MRMKLAAVLIAVVIANEVLLACPPARAQDVHAKIIPSLVFLKASGDLRSGPNTGQTVDSLGTGFIISSEGLVLTTAHLIRSLGDVVPNTVRLEARVGAKTAPDIGAQIVDWVDNLDLMLLKLPPSPMSSFREAVLGRAQDHDLTLPVYSSGFPKSIAIRSRGSTIQSKDGPGGYLWTTGFTFEAGESGSPIYEESGKVIGVVKGDESSLAYMIPIEYGDSLLAQIRLRDIQRSLDDFQGLRQNFNWSGTITKVPGGRMVALQYQKMVAGDPQVATVSLRIKAIGEIEGKRDSLKPFWINDLPRTAAIGVTGGVFELPNNLWESIETLAGVYKMDPIEQIQVDAIATLTNGIVMAKAPPILIPCEED